MIIKFITSIIIISGCAMVGILYANRFAERARLLLQLQSGLQQLETQILYTAIPLPEAFEKAGSCVGGAVGNSFISFSDELRKKSGYAIHLIWKNVFEKNAQFSVLNKEDMEILFQFGPGLGMSDRENQKKNFELIQHQLKSQLVKAEKDRAKNQGLYRSLGFLGGLMIAIILF